MGRPVAARSGGPLVPVGHLVGKARPLGYQPINHGLSRHQSARRHA